MHIACLCLNIKLEIQNFLNLEKYDIVLSPKERSHAYFGKDVYLMTGKLMNTHEAYPHLVKSEIVGSWNVCQCLICKIYAYGTNYVNGIATCSSMLQEEPTDLKTYGRDRNISYSQVFQVCFPCHLDVPEDFLQHLPNVDIVDGDTIQKITSQANSFLEMAERKMKLSGKTPPEKQIQAMDVLKRRVRCEERYLQLLILQSKTGNKEEDGTKANEPQFNRDIWSADPVRASPQTAIDGFDEPAQDTPSMDPSLHTHNNPFSTGDIQEQLMGLQLGRQRVGRAMSLAVGSTDVEGIFEMDDDDLPAGDPPHTSSHSPHSEESDEEDSFDFSEEFRERRHHAPPRDLARSVPLDVPAWPREFGREHRGVNAKRPKRPQEIAASMRELARSVRMTSEDVLGDLPRPKKKL